MMVKAEGVFGQGTAIFTGADKECGVIKKMFRLFIYAVPQGHIMRTWPGNEDPAHRQGRIICTGVAEIKYTAVSG